MTPRRRKPQTKPKSTKPAARPPKKVKEIEAPANFPVRGATMSPYAQAYYHNQGRSIGLDTPALKWYKKINWKKVLKRTAATLGIVVLIWGGWVGYKFYKNFGGWSGIFGLLHSTKLKGEDTGRVNILLAGNSTGVPGHGGAQLTDSIMILSINVKNNTAFMLSIPRDLYVSLPAGAIPDYTGYGKINQAILDTGFSQSGYPNGGMGDLENVISQNFGIPIDYYALINWAAFRDAVDAVGGITVDIHSCSPYGLYDPSIDLQTGKPLVHLSNGQHFLNGEQALDLARARGDGYGSYGYCQSDFTRTANQRMMLVALEKKALSLGVISNPIKLGDLFDSVGKNVKTDLSLSDMHRLYDLTKNLNNHIQSLSLSYGGANPLLTSYTTPEGQSALVPTLGLNDYSAIQAYIKKITYVAPKSN